MRQSRQLKVISMSQPWASLVVMGYKKLATFGWQTDYRGHLLIHAKKTWSKRDRDQAFAINYNLSSTHIPDFPYFKTLSLGAIVGSVYLMDIAPTDIIQPGHFEPATIIGSKTLHLNRLEKELDDYTPNRFAWLFSNANAYKKPGVQTLAENSTGRLWEFDEGTLFLELLKIKDGWEG